MKSKCPYCGSYTDHKEFPAEMSARNRRVYEAVVKAGPNGIPATDLLVRMYADKEWPTPGGGGVLRVQVHNINQIIAALDQKIVGKRSTGYRLISTREK